MTIRINSSTKLTLLIEDRELPLESGNILHMLHIVSGTPLTLPMLTFQFTDLLRVVPILGIQDNVLITLKIESTTDTTRRFRVQSWTKILVGESYQYLVKAVWDSTKYWSGTSVAGRQGTSSAVLKSIAETCGLGVYKNTETTDTMLWMPGNKTYGTWARNIAEHGYVDDKSHMVLGVDSLGTLRYKDINRNLKPVVSIGLLEARSSLYLQALDFTPSANSGVNNALLGFRHKRVLQSGIGKSSVETLLDLTPDSAVPTINAPQREKQERGLISYAPIDWGNVHDKYQRAIYQNARYDILNSVTGEFIFGYATPFEILDNFSFANPTELSNTDYDGEYTVTHKVVMIAGADYKEKLVAVRNGLN